MSKTVKKARPSDGFVRPMLPALDALDGEHRAVLQTLEHRTKIGRAHV